MGKSKNKIIVKEPYFLEIYNLYFSKKEEEGYYYSTTLKGYRSCIKRFLTYLEEKGFNSFEKIDNLCISNYIPWVKQYTPNALHNVLPALRSFFRFLNDNNIVKQNWDLCFQYPLPNKRKIQYGFSKNEIERLLGVCKSSVVCGKRDYAIVLLATYSGLRATDILNLKKTNIDWNKNEIRISQQKTGTELCLPLFPIVGNAIADYILNERPQSMSQEVFLRSLPPFTKLSMSGLTNIIVRKSNKAQVDQEHIKQHGIRGFRRSIGIRLLEENTPVDLIKEILGHRSANVIKTYLAVDIQHLKNCGFSLKGIEPQRKELL